MPTLHAKSYFDALFVPGYILPSSVAKDWAESSLFYLDDIGYRSDWSVFVSPPIPISIMDQSSTNIVSLPNLSNQDPSTVDFSDNLITSWSPPTEWTSCLSIDLHTNFLSSFDVPANLTLLHTLDVSANQLTSLTVDPACVAINGITASSNLLTDFVCVSSWVAIVLVDLRNNALLSSAMDHILIPLAATGQPVNVKLEGGTNAAIGTWSTAATIAKASIITNGGAVSNN